MAMLGSNSDGIWPIIELDEGDALCRGIPREEEGARKRGVGDGCTDERVGRREGEEQGELCAPVVGRFTRGGPGCLYGAWNAEQ